MIGGSYDFEVVKLALAYARTTDGWFATSNPAGASGTITVDGTSRKLGFGANQFADGFKANSYLLGLSAPIGGASSLFGSWQRVDPSNNKLTGDDATMNVFSAGYTYDLSSVPTCTPTVRTRRTTPSTMASRRPPSASACVTASNRKQGASPASIRSA